VTDQFVAEIRLFPYNFAPSGWARCDGQLLPLSQNTALFSLLGTNYGGDGKSTFGLPNLQGRVLLQQGQGAGLSERFLGESNGVDFVALLPSEMPIHNHYLQANATAGELSSPAPTRTLARPTGALVYTPPGDPKVPLAAEAVSVSGGSLPHNNLMPYLVMEYCIALQGIFPPRP
jgi:microcystin-dependent protein